MLVVVLLGVLQLLQNRICRITCDITKRSRQDVLEVYQEKARLLEAEWPAEQHRVSFANSTSKVCWRMLYMRVRIFEPADKRFHPSSYVHHGEERFATDFSRSAAKEKPSLPSN